ncbi:hypothetical protein AGOR_G00046820 [Albula goreensis]|uniref:Uncharacterized protein n=1 Tax=Albula goreensis TaxID=1534307 RepID=A0A8T3DXJ7_9TELE|nr:hypothetical protein AGOR_G00046820 [Albula goreensis]
MEAYSACPTLVGNLKSFCDRHGYEGLVILSSSLHDPHRQCQQVAVFSGNKDILNQICCELEEGRSCSLGLEPLCCVWETIQLYRQRGTFVYTEQILSLLRDFLDRRQPLFLLNSRTSSTEGVAGSAPLSQGSSGITDMYSSDAEPANAAENVPEPGGAPRGLGDVGSELVSPDSGLATVRSSRSSKESSVFLSDDSPVAETTAGFLHNPALSFPSLCAAAAAASSSGPVLYRERDRRPSPSPSARNVELFAFDPLRSPCSSPAAGGANEQSHSSGDRASSSLSEFGELSLVDFYTGSSDGSFVMDGGFPSPRLDPLLPATPLNSLTEEGGGGGGREGVPKFFPKEVADKMSTMGKKESVSSSEPWDDFTSDTKGSTSDDATAWSLSEPAYLGQESPDVYLDPQVGSKGGQGDDDSFLLVSVDSEATHSAGDDIFWATPNPTVSLDTAEAHLGQIDLQMLPAAGETQEDAGSEPSAEIRKSWGYFDGVNDDPVARISDAMRLLDPFSFPTTQNQPEGLEVTDAVHSSQNQESCPAVPLNPEGWEYQEERKDLPVNDRTSSSQSTDHQPTSGTEHLTTGESVSQTKWAEPDGECMQPLEDAEEVGERSVLRLVSQHTSVKQESCDKERQPAVSEYRDTQTSTPLDQHLEQEVGQFPDIGTTSPDTPEARTPAFPDITAETAKTHLVREVVLPNPDSTHMWNPFIPMTQPPETYDNWNPNLPVLDDTWRPGTLGDLQLTPPVEDMPFPPPSVGEPLTSKMPVGSNLIERAPLTPETSKEEDKSLSPDRLDFWSYSAQRGFLQATEPYPESLGLWNTTIRDDSQSTLSTPDLSERSDSLRSAPQAGPSLESPQEGPQRGLAMWNTTIQDTSPEDVAHSPHDTPGLVKEELDQGSQASSTHLESDDAQVVPQLLKDDYSDQSSKGQEDDVTTLPHRLSGHLTLEPCAWGTAAPSGMVKSVSEYDNVDPGEPWHQTSPELEPCQEMPEEHHPVVEHDCATESQLLADAAIERPDSTDDSSCHSPFVLLGVTPPLGGAMFPINQREDTPCPSTPSGDELSGTPSGQDRRYDWDDLSPLGKMERVEALTKEAEDGGSLVCWDSPNVKLPLW